MNVALVGVTGLVGQMFLRVLEERNFPVTDLIPVASENSVGKKIVFRNEEYEIIGLKEAVKKRPQLALFSAGGSISKEWAPKFAEVGCKVIDNSSAWRMDQDKKLIVPEVNASVLNKDDYIIANPNCSTIQMLVPLWPLHKKFKIKRIVVSTYQSVTGTGKNALDQMENERLGQEVKSVYPHIIDRNVIPHCDEFMDNGYTKEEMKLVNETNKIFGDDSIKTTATTVRVPVSGGHSESVNIEFENEYDIEDIYIIFANSNGVIVQDNVAKNDYPMPLYVNGRDEVFVGRIRRDFSNPKSLNLWIVADNLRKGAATNAIQIAEYMIEMRFL